MKTAWLMFVFFLIFAKKKDRTYVRNYCLIEMVKKNSIKLFGDDKIRAVWDEEQEKTVRCA